METEMSTDLSVKTRTKKVSEKVVWSPLLIEGSVNCPECKNVMVILDLNALPSLAFCGECKKYFTSTRDRI